MGLINHFPHDYSQSRLYSSHHSLPLDMGKPVVNHGDRWSSGSPTPAYPMASATPVSWGSYGKQQSQQQRLPPTPAMHTHLGDYHHYGSIEADYQGSGLLMAPVQHTPLSPPISEGLMSPDLNHQAWPHPYGVRSETTNIPLIDSSPLLGINTYNTGNMDAMQQAQPIIGVKRKAMGSLFPDVSGRQAQRKKRRLTEPAEANYHCQTCGKYFSRVWNYNAHRETHDPSRPKPHVCNHPNCEKAFVRRTDLTRHVQCVGYPLFIQKVLCPVADPKFSRSTPKTRNSNAACAITVLLGKTHSAGMFLLTYAPRIPITDSIPTGMKMTVVLSG